MPFLGRRRKIGKRSKKLLRSVRISPMLDDLLIEIAESEGKRSYREVGGALMLLGAGVWRRLREHPTISKQYVFEDKAELLLLADLQITEALYAVQADTAEAFIARNRRLRERSDYY